MPSNTRQSTEEGLEQDSNTLQAQREAAEAYIVSQKQNGWNTLADSYDEGGFTGASNIRARDGARSGRPCESRGFFSDREVLWDYEGPSRDPAHRRPVAEIVARRGMSHAGRVNGIVLPADMQIR